MSYDITLDSFNTYLEEHEVNDNLLHHAVKKKDIIMTKNLIKQGFDVNAKIKYDIVPLELAIANKDVEMIELLLAHGADPEFKDNNNQVRPLHLAASYFHLESVKVLIAAGCDVNAKNTYNETPLFCAISRNGMYTY